MNDVDKLTKIQAIKTLRKRKAEVAYIQTAAKTEQVAQRAKTLLERHQAKETLAKGYAQNRFMQLQSTNNLELFFTTMTVGLLRHRKEVASLGLRTKRVEHEHRTALKEQQLASEVFARATNAEKLIGDAHNAAQDEADNTSELDAEEDLMELINVGTQFHD